MTLGSKINKYSAFCRLENIHSTKQWCRQNTDNRKSNKMLFGVHALHASPNNIKVLLWLLNIQQIGFQ